MAKLKAKGQGSISHPLRGHGKDVDAERGEILEPIIYSTSIAMDYTNRYIPGRGICQQCIKFK